MSLQQQYNRFASEQLARAFTRTVLLAALLGGFLGAALGYVLASW